MYTFTKKVLIALTYCHAKADSGYPIGFRVSADFGFEMDFDPNRFLDRVRILSSGFDFGCPDTLSDPNPIHCHPLPPDQGLVGGFWGLEIGVAFAA